MSETLPGGTTDSPPATSVEHALTPEPADVNPWSDAEQQLRQLVDDARIRAAGSHADWSDSIEDLFKQWSKTLDDLANKHGMHVDKLAGQRPDSGALPPGVLAEYRSAFTKDILQPLLDVSSRNRPPTDVAARFWKMVDALTALPDRFPENTRLLEPKELYDRRTEDSATIQLRKAAHRMLLSGSDFLHGSRVLLDKVLRREVRRRLPTSRVIPARHLAIYHLRQSLPDLLIEEHSAAQRQLFQLVGTLERLIGAWTNGVLVVERDVEPDAEARGSMVPWDAVPSPPQPESDAVKERDDTGKSAAPPATEDEEPSKEKDTPVPLFDVLHQQATSLQQGLEKLSALAVPPEPAESDPVGEVFASLDVDLRKGGTGLLATSKRPLLDQPRGVQLLASAQAKWDEWHREVDQRFRYYLGLMKLRDELVGLERRLVIRVGRATVEQVLMTFADMMQRFEAVGSDVGVRAAEARKEKSPPRLLQHLDKSGNQLVDFLQGIFHQLPGLVSSDQALSDPGRTEWDQLTRVAARLPELVTMHSLQEEDLAKESRRPIQIEVSSLVLDVIEPPLPDRLRRPAEQLRAAVRRVWTETEQVHHIVQYNIDAATDELKAFLEEKVEVKAAGRENQDPDEKPPLTVEETIDASSKLVTDGLSRASTTLAQLATTLHPAWTDFVKTVNAEFRQDWIDVHRRLHTADTAEEQWAGFRSQLERRFEKDLGRARVRWQIIAASVTRIATASRRRVASLIKIGQSAVGVLDSGDTGRFDTIDALSGVSTLQESLPLIYRRLFSFDPLDEASLLEGRSRDLVSVKQHFTRWKDSHQLGVLLVQAPLGSGRTSTMNVLQDTVFKDYEVARISLKERIYHPDEFAVLIATGLGYENPEITLEELEEDLIHSKRSQPPHVCFIDNMEHLVLRAAQGVNIIERVILFLSRTDRSMYWLGTVGSYTWQFLSKTAGKAVGFVDTYQLTPFDRDMIESLIINRHRRSGMTLQFVEPTDASALMRQRLKRAKTPEQLQSLLREDYFDRLWRASGQNVMLALFYWIRSAEFNEENSTLTVRSLAPLRFDYLNDLTLDHAFTLKAFFLHKTLSLADHSRIFTTSEADSTVILESLLNGYFIEEVPLAERKANGDYHVKKHAIYRLRPLILHPVTSFLQSKNIIY
ncbi:MAG: hypothetical protein HKN37_08550 [Rhodothermales bacterium]|nr:hypothetical protein [Rhodothermales bacterium]